MSNQNFTLTQERLKELLHYDPETGVFTKLNGRYAGIVCNKAAVVGYIRITVDSQRDYAHRIAFLYMTGAFPKECVDHINLIKTDNRWCNLRQVSRQTNNQNITQAKKHNNSGYLGIHWRKKLKKWAASVRVDNKTKHIGYFNTPEEAHQAYINKKRILHVGNTL